MRVEFVSTLNKFNNQKLQIIGCKSFSVRLPIYLKEDEILKLDLSNTFVSLNKIMHQRDISNLESFISKLGDAKGIIFSDLSVFQIAKRYNLTHKLIYDPQTLITNVMELKFWEEMNIYGIFVSPFIRIDELLSFKSSLKIFFIGYGYLPLFYSKRKLITNYCMHNNIAYENLIDNKDLYLKEELRDGKYKIIEDENGTHVFTPYIFNASKYLDEITNIDYLVLDYNFIDEDFYDRFINKVYNANESDGFLSQKIIYKK